MPLNYETYFRHLRNLGGKIPLNSSLEDLANTLILDFWALLNIEAFYSGIN